MTIRTGLAALALILVPALSYASCSERDHQARRRDPIEDLSADKRANDDAKRYGPFENGVPVERAAHKRCQGSTARKAREESTSVSQRGP